MAVRWRTTSAAPSLRDVAKCISINRNAKSKLKPREVLMNKLIIPAVIGAIGAASAVAWSQAPAPNPNVKIYYTTPLEHDASRIVRLQSITIPPKEGNNFHRHPGDQWSAVQEGERSEEHTSELQSHLNLVCRLLLEKK